MRGKSTQITALISVALLCAACAGQSLPSSPFGTPAETPTVDPGSLIALPWDTTVSPSHEIMCAYKGEGINGESVGQAAGCSHHSNGTSLSYTQDGYALDFDLKAGEEVVSPSGGVVRWAGTYSGSSSWSCYGKSVAVDTQIGGGAGVMVITEFYAHLQSISVTAGQPVKAGQPIGQAGSSGGGTNSVCPSAYGPHLHFAMYGDAHYLGADGKDVEAHRLLNDVTNAANYWAVMSSPPYGGVALEPGPWKGCMRSSALASPPAGEDSTCTKLHAGDMLTTTGGTSAGDSSLSEITAGPSAQPLGPTAPLPPFTQAQADLCHKQTDSISDAWIATGADPNNGIPSSRDGIMLLLKPTLAAMVAVQQSGSDLLEPALSAGIAQLESLRDQLSQPMTADAISRAYGEFWWVVPNTYFQEDPNGLASNCRMIDAWIAANVKK